MIYIRNGLNQLEKHMTLYATYSDIVGKVASKQEVIDAIQKIDMYEALNIISQLSALSKIEQAELTNKLVKSMNSKFSNKYVAFHHSNLHYTIKWFIAYGIKSNPNTILNVNKMEFPPAFHVVLITLMVADFMEAIDGVSNISKTIFTSLLRDDDHYTGTTIARQEAFYFDILPKVQKKYPEQYPEISLIFETKNQYSIADYSNFLYGIGKDAVLERTLMQLDNTSSYHKNPFHYLNKSMNRDKIKKLTDDLSIDPFELKDWALKTLDNYNDMDSFLRYPFFKNENLLFPISTVFLNYAIFDGLFFKIKETMSNKSEEKGLFSLFGRLFEEYIEKLISESVAVSKIPYNIIQEFSFNYKKQEIKSSDLYLQLGRQILVIECKSKRVLRDTKILADEKSTSSDFNEVVIKPINQAASRMQQLKEINHFSNKLRPTILAVSYNGFPKVEDYHQQIGDDWSDFNWDYLSITEMEYLASYIQYSPQGNTVFKFLRHKNNTEDYLPHALKFYQELEKIRNKRNLKNFRPIYINEMMKQGFSRLEQNLKRGTELLNDRDQH